MSNKQIPNTIGTTIAAAWLLSLPDSRPSLLGSGSFSCVLWVIRVDMADWLFEIAELDDWLVEIAELTDWLVWIVELIDWLVGIVELTDWLVGIAELTDWLFGVSELTDWLVVIAELTDWLVGIFVHIPDEFTALVVQSEVSHSCLCQSIPSEHLDTD